MYSRIFARTCSNVFNIMRKTSLILPAIGYGKLKTTLSGGMYSTFLASTMIPACFTVQAFGKSKSEYQKDKIEDIIKKADLLYNELKFDELFDLLSAKKDTKDAEILWRLARAIYEKARTVTNTKEKTALYEEAFEYVQEALEVNEQCSSAHRWNAILLDYVWRYRSTKGRIQQSYICRKHIERAIELNPKDSTAYYILGEWCFSFADMPWYQRKLAAAIFSSPPTSTYEEALQYYEKAEQISPHFYSLNLLMIAKCLLKMNEKEKAISFLKQARDYTVKTDDDKQAKTEAEKLLRGLNID